MGFRSDQISNQVYVGELGYIRRNGRVMRYEDMAEFRPHAVWLSASRLPQSSRLT